MRKGVPFALLAAAACQAPQPSSRSAPALAVPIATSDAPPAPPASPPPMPSPSPPAAPRPGVFANTNPYDDLVVGPPDWVADCEEDLGKEGVTFRHADLKVHEIKKTKIVCGAYQVVTYLKGPGAIAYNAPPLLTCRMAHALAWFEKLVQEEAAKTLGTKITRIDHLGTYSCREIQAYPGWVSEHSYANAIDISRFTLADGRTIEVKRDFDIGDDPPKKPAGVFLRVISRRANDEDMFSHVLTPFFNAHHHDHFHLDLARYRTDGTRRLQ